MKVAASCFVLHRTQVEFLYAGVRCSPTDFVPEIHRIEIVLVIDFC